MFRNARFYLFALSYVLAACAAAQPARGHGAAETESRRPAGAVPLATALARSGGVPALEGESVAVPAALAPDRVLAPSIGLDAPVVATDWTPGGEWRVPPGAAGWLEISAYAGAPGNTVLAGHQNVQGEVFRRVAELRIGDALTLLAGGQAVEFRVAERFILPAWGIPPEQERQYATWIARTDDTRLTLVTCWPYYTNSHRVVVVARPTGR